MKSDKQHPPGNVPAGEHGTHGDPDPHGAGTDHGPHDNTKYYWVFFWLCVLTSLSFITMHFFGNTPSVGWTVMMAVSCTKALLVMCFFMHLIWEANWKYVLTIPAGMMSIFLLIMLIPDVGCRTDIYTDERWLHAPVPVTAGEHAPHPDHPADSDDGHKKHPEKPEEK